MLPFEEVTQESLKADFIEAYQGSLDTRDGSFLDLMISPLIWELYKGYAAMGNLYAIVFPDETSGICLDWAGALLGIARRAGTQAEAPVTFAGTDGLTVPAGTAFLTEDGREYRLTEDVILADGAGAGTLRALEAGAEYNAAAGAILRMYSALPGLTSFEAGEAVGGTDPESDRSLYNRLNYRRQHPSSSGNDADYYNWATSVEGVGDAYIISKMNGPGTVGVILSAPDGGAVEPEVVTAVADYIETQRPTTAAVTVKSATEKEIDVTAQITHEAGTDLETIKAAFTAELREYLTSLGIGGGTLSYNRVAYLLLNVSGVSDFTTLTVNGGTAAVKLDPGVAAMTGTVDLSEVSP